VALLKNLPCQAGYRVLAASTGEEALLLARRAEGRVHLLIADIILPGMDGRRLSETLKREYPGLETLFISGYTDVGIVRKGMAGNGRHFLAKPFQPKDLLAKIRSLLDKRTGEA
jgi:two-component system cell cycle sensor histidine kinase/response regulator CckA